MLVNFRVENFKSYKNLEEISMEATKLKKLKESNAFNINNISLLKSAVIYGANASGKSSLLDAMRGMKSIIKNSIFPKKSKHYLPKAFLLNTETKNRETFFEIEFIIDEIIYRYGFEIFIDAIILKEWLYQKKLQPKARETHLFTREKSEIILGASFKEGKLLIDKTRKDALFLSVVAQFNGEISNKILNWFNKFTILSNNPNNGFENNSFDKLEDSEFKDKITNFIKGSDVGIHDILKKQISFDELKKDNPNIEKLPSFIIDDMKKKGLSTIQTIHIQYNMNNEFNQFEVFNLGFESDGTQKLLALSAPILEALTKGEILVIDELDNSLHTELLKAIVMLFNSKETNPNNAQLIFTTHDTNLLNQKFFRRDQIWFTEKDIYGATDLYSLLEYGKGKTRDDLELAKNYQKGKFGAIPHIALDYEAK